MITYLIPVGEWLCGCRTEPDTLLWSDEGNIEPEGKTVNFVRLINLEAQWNIHNMEIVLVIFQEIDNILLRFGNTDSNIESVNDRLMEEFFDCFITQNREIDAVEVVLQPEVGFCYLNVKKQRLEND